MKHEPVAAFASAEPLNGLPKAKGAFHYWKKHLMMLAVSRCEPLTGNAAKVLLRIIAYANESTGLAWPSLDTLADETGFSRKVVKVAIANAETCGLLTVDRSAGGRHGETHTFRPAWHLAVKEGGPSRDRVRGPSREATGSFQGTDGVPVGHGRGPSRDPDQVGPIRKEEIRKENSRVAPEGAGLSVLPSGKEDRPSRCISRSERIALPDSFGFEAVDVEAAMARGHTSESIAEARRKFGTHYAGKVMPVDKWHEAGRKWIGDERPPQADLSELVKVCGNGLATEPKVPRRFVKPHQSFVDSKGNRHSAANSQGVRTVTPPKPDHTRPVPATHPGAVLMTADWRPSQATWDDLRYKQCSVDEAEKSLARFLRTYDGHHLADPEAAARQWWRLCESTAAPLSSDRMSTSI